MNLKMQKSNSLEQIRSFVAGTACVSLAIPAGQDRHQWMAQRLKQFAFARDTDSLFR